MRANGILTEPLKYRAEDLGRERGFLMSRVMSRFFVLGATFALVFSLAVPAFAVDGSVGAGATFGTHHAGMAQEMEGFTGEMNPGVHHQGFSGWTGM